MRKTLTIVILCIMIQANFSCLFKRGGSSGGGSGSGSSSESKPDAPSNLTATASSSIQIDLAWTDNSNNEDGFKIERSTDNSTFTEIASVSAGVTAYSDSGLDALTTYYYRVRAHNSVGNSDYSNTASAQTTESTPNAPSGLTATGGSGKINLSWTDNSGVEDGFKIERSIDNSTFSQIGTVSADVTSYSDTTASGSITYYYRVRAYNSKGHSGYSATASASRSFVVSTPDSSGDVGSYASIAIDSNGKVHISYYDNTNADVKYVTNASGSWSTSTKDSSGDVGRYTSIAIDSSNKVHISYYDVSNGDLKYAN